MSKLENLNIELDLAKSELKDFENANSVILKKKKDLKSKVSNLEKQIKLELRNNKPKFPVEDLELRIFSRLFRWSENKVTQNHIDQYLSEDSDVIGLEAILGWTVVYESDAASTRTDGDWYDYSLEVTSPEGYVYSASGETCLMVGDEFDGMELE